jgi:hypothetical protein
VALLVTATRKTSARPRAVPAGYNQISCRTSLGNPLKGFGAPGLVPLVHARAINADHH